MDLAEQEDQRDVGDMLSSVIADVFMSEIARRWLGIGGIGEICCRRPKLKKFNFIIVCRPKVPTETDKIISFQQKILYTKNFTLL